MCASALQSSAPRRRLRRRPCAFFENHSPAPSRRARLIKSGLAGGFVLAFHLPVKATPVNEPEKPAPDDTAGKFAPNAFIRIHHAGKTTLVMPQVEMDKASTPRWR